MARIRTIKPEFPQSETIGKLSRDARLLFIQLWTICDDAGRTRGASRMLASLLYPYDTDAPSLIDDWLAELDRLGVIIRYRVGDNAYVQVAKWREHQKIDRPSDSRLPPFANNREASRVLDEPSTTDLGPRTVDLGPVPRTVDRGPKVKSVRAQTALTEPEAFTAFYARYPKKVGKGDALKAWITLNPSPELIAEIHRALDWQIGQPKWKENGGEFIKHPSGWIRGRRWEDAPIAPVRPRSLGPVYTDDDWFEECKRLHNGECGLERHRHAHRMDMEAAKAASA